MNLSEIYLGELQDFMRRTEIKLELATSIRGAALVK
jgi:hypothetical protein